MGLPVGWKLIDDSIDGRNGRRGVKGAENQVSGLSGFNCNGDGLQVAHLADEHDVRILSKCRPQCILERVGMLADLPLVHETVSVRVHEFDGIFDGDDVIGSILVDVIHHGR